MTEPTANNCCFACEVGDSDSAFTTLVGDWTEGENEGNLPPYGLTTHITEDINAVRYWTTPADAAKPWRVIGTAFPIFTATGAEHFTITLYGGALNISNFVKLEFEFWNLGDAAGGTRWWYQLRLSYVESAASPVLLASHPWADETGAYHIRGNLDHFPDEPGEREIEMELCWDGVQLTGRVACSFFIFAGPQMEFIIAHRGYTPLGGYAGIGTGPELTDVESITWQDLLFSMSYDTGPAEECPACPTHCCDGNVPPEYIAEVDAVAEDGSEDFCDTCVNGSPTLVAVDPRYYYLYSATSFDNREFTTGVEWAGDGSCVYRHQPWLPTGDVSDNCEWYEPGNPTPNFTPIRYELTFFYDGATKYASLQVYSVDYVTGIPPDHIGDMLAAFIAEVPEPCEDLTDWVDLEPDGDVETEHCDDDAATARFKIPA